MELGHQRRAELLTNREPVGSGLAVDGALDVEQRVEPLHRLERDGVDHASSLAAALLAGSALDVGEFEELAPGVREAAGFEHRTGRATVAVQLAVATIGVGLEDARPDARCACGCADSCVMARAIPE